MKKFLVFMLLLIAAATFAGCSRETISTSSKMNASASTAQIRSEGMRIWSRPLELGFVIDKSKGDDGRIVSVYPKQGEISRKLTPQEAVLVQNAGNRDLIPVYGGKDFKFENLDPIQQAAVLQIIKDENIDGFYVTMIEETIFTSVTSQKLVIGEAVNGNNKYQVTVIGFALKIKDFAEVNEQRADAERNAAAASKEKETIIYAK